MTVGFLEQFIAEKHYLDMHAFTTEKRAIATGQATRRQISRMS